MPTTTSPSPSDSWYAEIPASTIRTPTMMMQHQEKESRFQMALWSSGLDC